MLQHWASKDDYIRRSKFLYQFIDPVTFSHCAFIFALRNITLGGYLDTQKHLEHLRHDERPDIYIVKILAIETLYRKLASLAVKFYMI